MCEFASFDKKIEAIKHFQQHGLSISMPLLDFQRRFPFSFQPARCPVDGVHLSKKDIKPAGRATRSMCVPCYESLVANNTDEYCFVCANPLPDAKFSKQMKNPKEIQYHIHDGECLSLWTVMHNIVLGETDILRAVPIPAQKPLVEEKPIYKGKPVRLII